MSASLKGIITEASVNFKFPIGSTIANGTRVDGIELGLNVSAYPELEPILRYFADYTKDGGVRVLNKCIDINALDDSVSPFVKAAGNIKYNASYKRVHFCKDGDHYFVLTTEVDKGAVKMKIYDPFHKDHPKANIGIKLRRMFSGIEITEFRPHPIIMPESIDIEDSIIYAANVIGDLIYGNNIDRNNDRVYDSIEYRIIEERAKFALNGSLIGMRPQRLCLNNDFLIRIGNNHNYIREEIEKVDRRIKKDVAGRGYRDVEEDPAAAAVSDGALPTIAEKKGLRWRLEGIEDIKPMRGREGVKGYVGLGDETYQNILRAEDGAKARTPRKSILTAGRKLAPLPEGVVAAAAMTPRVAEVAPKPKVHFAAPPEESATPRSAASPRLVKYREGEDATVYLKK